MADQPTKPRRKRNDHGEPRRSNAGRPHELDRQLQLRDGRTTTVADAAVERIATGIPIVQAAGGLGVRQQTIHDWRRRGVRARSRQQAGEPITDTDELRLIQFADRCDEAEALAYSTDWTRLGTIAAGGLERVTVTHRQTVGKDGELVTLTDRKVETLLPDAKAIQWRLAVRFGLTPKTQVELSGVDGGAIPVELTATALAGRLRQFVEASVSEVAVPDLAPDGNGMAELGGGDSPAPQGPPLSGRMMDMPSPNADVPPPPD